MQVFSQVSLETRREICALTVGDTIEALGTSAYDKACFDMLESLLDIDHWALYCYSTLDSVRCIATASRLHSAAAQQNVRAYVSGCHKADPSLSALKRRKSDKCIVKICLDDIVDRQYRSCFEITRVNERVSYFSWVGADLMQVTIYSGTQRRSFTERDFGLFAGLSRIIVASALKHEALHKISDPRLPLDCQSIELFLAGSTAGLSERERQVCARAAVGMSIDATAAELGIQRTSVITYRQRSYRKLGISRQNELVAMISNMRSSANLQPIY